MCYNRKIGLEFPLSWLVLFTKSKNPFFYMFILFAKISRFIDKSCTSYLLNKIIESGGNPNEESHFFDIGYCSADEHPNDVGICQQAEKLIDALDLPFTYYSINTCVYTKEIHDYIVGEWDGSDRTGDDFGGYNAARYVMSREYYWIASNLINGKSYSLSANVDYEDYKEVVPARSSNQSYSLAVSRITGEVEQL